MARAVRACEAASSSAVRGEGARRREIDPVAAGDLDQALELLLLVRVAALADEVAVRVVPGVRSGTAPQREQPPLLGEVLTREPVGEVGGGEDQPRGGVVQHRRPT